MRAVEVPPGRYSARGRVIAEPSPLADGEQEFYSLEQGLFQSRQNLAGSSEVVFFGPDPLGFEDWNRVQWVRGRRGTWIGSDRFGGLYRVDHVEPRLGRPFWQSLFVCDVLGALTGRSLTSAVARHRAGRLRGMAVERYYAHDQGAAS